MDHDGSNFPKNCQNDLQESFYNKSKQHEVDLQYRYMIYMLLCSLLLCDHFAIH